jgi:protein ImuA
VLGEEQGGLMARKPDEETGEAAANWAAGLRLRHPLRRA